MDESSSRADSRDERTSGPTDPTTLPAPGQSMSVAGRETNGNRSDASREAAPVTDPIGESASAASPRLASGRSGDDAASAAASCVAASLLPPPSASQLPSPAPAPAPLPPSPFLPASHHGPPSPFFHPAAAYSSPLRQPQPPPPPPGSAFFPTPNGAGMVGGYASPSMLPSPAHPHDFYVSHNNPYATSAYAHPQQQQHGGVGVGGVAYGSSPWPSSLSLHSSQSSVAPSRGTLHATRHRKRRARGPDEKTILAATRLLRLHGVDTAVRVAAAPDHQADGQQADQEEGARAQAEEEQGREEEEEEDAPHEEEADRSAPSSKASSSSSSPAGAQSARSEVASASASAAAAAQAAAAAAAAVAPLPVPVPVPAPSAAASSRDSSPRLSPAAPSSSASDEPVSTSPASSALPAAALDASQSAAVGGGSSASREEARYPTLLDVAADPSLFDCADFVIQHGAHLPPLHVRFVADMNGSTAPPPPADADAAAEGVGSAPIPAVGAVVANPTEAALRWLLEDLDADGDPVLGIDAEGRQIHLLQLSTRSRCVLIKLPKYTVDKDEGKAKQTQTASQANGSTTTMTTTTTAAPAAASSSSSANGTAHATPTLTAQPAPSTPALQPQPNAHGANQTAVSSVWQTNPPAVSNGLESSPLPAPLPAPASAAPSASISVPSPDPSSGPPSALYHARGVSSGASPPPFPVPALLRSLLEDASISKSGAELWGDALDIHRDLGIMLNGGLDMTRAFTSRLSLELMTNVALVGVEAAQQGVSAFLKDRATTTSAWDAEQLSMRQLVYAALDAQTSYFIGKNLSRPPSFDLRRLSQPWLQQAGSWLLMSKFMEHAQEKELRTSFDDMIVTENGISVICSQYNKRIRLGSDVTVHLTDGSKVSCLVSGVSGRRADLEWENAAEMMQRDSKDVDIERITLTRKWEDTLLPRPVKLYLQSVVHSEGENHPIVAALLSFFYAGPDVADPTLLAKELAATSNLGAAMTPAHAPTSASASAAASVDSSSTPSSSAQLPAELLQQPWIRDLNDSQRDAVALALWNPLVSVQGPPGSGKCFMRGTQLMLANGRCKAVESLTPADELMGDDGTPRRIQPASIRYGADGRRLPTGCGRLFTIASAAAGTGRIPFTVNEEHILVLRLKGRLWQPELREFMAAPPEVQRRARMIQAPALPFTGHNGGLTRILGKVLNRPASGAEAAHWSWLLGVWLACGEEGKDEEPLLRLPCDRSGSRVHDSHQPICERLQAWRATLLPTATATAALPTASIPLVLPSSCERPSSSFCRIPLDGRCGVFARVLRRLSLMGGRACDRRLPWSLLTETIPIRSSLLAGLVDGCGSLADDSHSLLLQLPAGRASGCVQQVSSLCRGLGFCASDAAASVSLDPQSPCSVTVSGFGLHALPLSLEWKRPASSGRNEDEDEDGDSSSFSSSSRFFPFTVHSCGVGDYFGFEVDGNRRFLLSDCTVTHNTSTIAAIVRTLICDPACRVLCVARTNTAARHMASACAKYIGPNKLTLQVSTEFFREWHEAQYQELLDGGYVPSMTGGFDGRYRDHQVLVMTTGICFTRPELTQGRTVVILDESSQIWDLEALLFLRSMDSCRQLVMFGDLKQLSCYVAPEWRVSANSILDLANLAATRARVFPRHWHDTGLLQVRQCMLTTQYRMVKHLGDMISSLFYDGVLRSADSSSVRAVSWHDVRGFSQSDDAYSVYNLAEVNEVIRLWRHLCAHGYRPDQIVVISLYEAQRQKLAETGVISEHRIFNCDSFQGQEAPIVILVLANNVTTEFLRDSRRVNVACSRAQQRLYIVGDLSTFSSPDAGVWQHIARYATSEWRPAMALPDVVDEVDFPALAASASAGAASHTHASSPAGSATHAPPSAASSSAAASRPAAVSSWAASSKPPASILSAMKASPIHSPSPSPSLHRSAGGAAAAAGAAAPLGGSLMSSAQSHVAVVLRGQNGSGTAPSTPQSHAQPPPLHHSPVPSTLLSRLSQAAMGAPSAFPSAVSSAASFASAVAAAAAASLSSSLSISSSRSGSRSLTSRAAPFVPSRSALEFVPGAAFRLPVSAPSAPALPLTSVPAPAPSAHADAAAPSALFAATAAASTAAPASASVAASVSPADVPASALASSLPAALSPSPSCAAAPPCAAAGAAVAPSFPPPPPPVPSTPSAAVLSPASVPSIHHPDSFPPVSASLLPAPALTHQPPRSAPLSFAARVAAAAAAAAANPSASANAAVAPSSTAVAAALPPSSSFASSASAASLPSAAATVFAAATTVVATPPAFRSSGAWQNRAVLTAAKQTTATAMHATTTTRAGPPLHAQTQSQTHQALPSYATPAPAPAPSASAAGSSKKSKPVVVSRSRASGWNCAACSFLNLTAERFCEMCETPREA